MVERYHLMLHERMATGRALTFIVSTILATSGCSAEAQKAPTRVSFSDYEAAVMVFRDCMESSGYPIIELRLDNQSRVYSYSVMAEAVRDGTFGKCYADFELFDSTWQLGRLSSADDQAGPTSPIFAATEQCYGELGIDANGAKTLGDLYALGEAQGVDPTRCTFYQVSDDATAS